VALFGDGEDRLRDEQANRHESLTCRAVSGVKNDGVSNGLITLRA
jgi:hypothetical protein